MGFNNTEVELLIPKKQNANNKTIKTKPLNWHDAVGEKLGEGNTTTVKQPVVTEKPKTKVSIGL